MAEIKSQKLLDSKVNGFDMRQPIENNAEEEFYQMGINLAKRLVDRRQFPRIVIGGDSRFTTPHLKKKLEEGLRESSVQVIDLGSHLPTPLIYFGYEIYDADAVAVITASHSSWNWNGIKVNFREDADVTHERRKYKGSICSYQERGIKDHYKNILLKEFIDLKKLTVAIDPLWGSYSDFAVEVFSALGHRTISNLYLHHCMDGFFPGLAENSPDPHKEKNLEHLVTEVKKFRGRLDFGVAFDGDGDRAKFIDETGEIISEDEITALISIYLIQEYRQKHLEGKPKTTKPKIIIELKSSKLVEEAVTKVEGEIVREKTGRIYIKEHMARDNDIIFGGELSGHYFYRKYFCGREFYPVDTGEDGLFTALLLGRIVQESGKQLSQLRAELPKYETSGEIRYTYRKEKKGEEMESEITKILKQLRDFYSEDAGDSQRKSFMLKVIERDEDTRVEIGGQDGKQDHYCSVIFRNSKNDPQKLTLVFEGKTKESLDYIRQDFLGRIAKIESLDSKYSGLRESLEKKVFPGG